ncbi:3926_t:CDS:2, partial [Acaulospora colombiana]
DGSNRCFSSSGCGRLSPPLSVSGKNCAPKRAQEARRQRPKQTASQLVSDLSTDLPSPTCNSLQSLPVTFFCYKTTTLSKQLVAPLFFALAASAAFTIDTPAINQAPSPEGETAPPSGKHPLCKDVSFKIGGNQGKVRLQVLPSVNPCEHDPLADSGEFDLAADGVYTWSNLNVAAGTSIVVVADDDSDNEAWTATVRQL